MHESGVVRALVDRMDRVARDAGALRVAGATVWLGAFSQFSREHFQAHFDEESRGTLAEGAVLHLELSDDVAHPDAQHVVMRNIDLDMPETTG